MALAVLGFIVGSAVLLACLIILSARMSRARRTRAADCTPHGSTGDGAWIPAYGNDAADCGSADAGAGCDGGGGD